MLNQKKAADEESFGFRLKRRPCDVENDDTQQQGKPSAFDFSQLKVFCKTSSDGQNKHEECGPERKKVPDIYSSFQQKRLSTVSGVNDPKLHENLKTLIEKQKTKDELSNIIDPEKNSIDKKQIKIHTPKKNLSPLDKTELNPSQNNRKSFLLNTPENNQDGLYHTNSDVKPMTSQHNDGNSHLDTLPSEHDHKSLLQSLELYSFGSYDSSCEGNFIFSSGKKPYHTTQSLVSTNTKPEYILNLTNRHFSTHNLYPSSNYMPCYMNRSIEDGYTQEYERQRFVQATSNKSKRGRKTCHIDRDSTMFDVDVDRIHECGKTTFMIRNIPNKYSQEMLIQMIDEKFKGTYDFFYLPIDFNNNCNVGYAFINFITLKSVAAFFKEMSGIKWDKFSSQKICEIKYARIQGKADLLKHFENSRIMNQQDSKMKPNFNNYQQNNMH